MLKRIFNGLVVILFIFNISAFAGSSEFFHVESSGAPLPQPISITLCLNVSGSKPLSCQNFAFQKATVAINTLVPNRVYLNAGIKVLTPG